MIVGQRVEEKGKSRTPLVAGIERRQQEFGKVLTKSRTIWATIKVLTNETITALLIVIVMMR